MSDCICERGFGMNLSCPTHGVLPYYRDADARPAVAADPPGDGPGALSVAAYNAVTEWEYGMRGEAMYAAMRNLRDVLRAGAAATNDAE